MVSFPRGRSLAFQKEEDMQEDMSADEKATGAGAFPREMETMKKVVGDAANRVKGSDKGEMSRQCYRVWSKHGQRNQHRWLKFVIGVKLCP